MIHLDKRLTTFTVVLLVCIMPIIITSNSTIGSTNDTSFLPSGIDIQQLLPDPDMNSPPDVHINGTSGEFASYHMQAAGFESESYVGLVWNHTAGTELDWKNADDVDQSYNTAHDNDPPDCNDFIYFAQEISWNLEEVPRDAYMNFSVSISKTGDFLDLTPAGLMFKVYVWLIDSSGNWDRLYKSSPPYPEAYVTRYTDLDYFHIENGWRGMVENSSGIQEDPSDTLTFAVGLTPTFNFQSYLDTNPWLDYTGTVTVKISSACFYSFMNIDPAPDDILEPLANDTWGGKIHDIFPEVHEVFENATDEYRGIVTGADSSVYVLAESKVSNILRMITGKFFQYQTLLKYDSQLNPIWVNKHRNQTTALDICFKDDFIYTVGSEYINESWDLLVTKWDPNGNIVWDTIWDTGIDEHGGAVGVADDGSVYVLAERSNPSDPNPPHIREGHVLKFNSNGEFEWNATTNMSGYAGKMQIEVTSNGIYTCDSSFVSYRDFFGIELWNTSAKVITVDSEGNLYSASDYPPVNGRGLRFNKTDSTGHAQWSTIFTISYNGTWSELLSCLSISVAPDGSLIAFLQNMWLSIEHYLVRFSPAGVYEWHKIIGEPSWMQPLENARFICVDSNGVTYQGITLYDGERDIEIYSYDVTTETTTDTSTTETTTDTSTTETTTDTNTTTPISSEMNMVIVILGGSVLGIALLMVIVHKRKPLGG